MTAPSFEERIRRAEEVLARVASGDLNVRLECALRDDALSPLEMGINFLIVDLRSSAEENQRKNDALAAQQRELESRLEKISHQAEAIRELSTPVIEVWDDILALPIVGVVDTQRISDIMNNLLEKIVASRAKCVIIDITGVAIVDTQTADHLLRITRAATLLGTRCVLTGLSPAIAQTLVAIGADLRELRTLRNLKDGLEDCRAWLKSTESGR
jgi:rsbT co-antagonist protein RsbR